MTDRRWLGASLGLLLFAAACTGADVNATDDLVPYFDQLEQITVDFEERSQRNEGLSQTDIESTRVFFAALISSSEIALDELSSLDPPEAAREPHDRLVELGGQYLALNKRIVDRLGTIETTEEFAALGSDEELGSPEGPVAQGEQRGCQNRRDRQRNGVFVSQLSQARSGPPRSSPPSVASAAISRLLFGRLFRRHLAGGLWKKSVAIQAKDRFGLHGSFGTPHECGQDNELQKRGRRVKQKKRPHEVGTQCGGNEHPLDQRVGAASYTGHGQPCQPAPQGCVEDETDDPSGCQYVQRLAVGSVKFRRLVDGVSCPGVPVERYCEVVATPTGDGARCEGLESDPRPDAALGRGTFSAFSERPL